MKASICVLLSVLSLAHHVKAQSLLEAISAYPELSNFTDLMTANQQLADALLTSDANLNGEPSTVLVPDNSAFTKLSVLYNVSMSNLTTEQLIPYLQYHLLVGEVTTDNLTAEQGLTVPTFLNTPQFNNRTAGAALGSSGAENDPHNGQVVFLEAKQEINSSSGRRMFQVRQLQNPTINAQGGLGHMINLTAIDGVWDGGYFQIVDKFLSLPLNCTESIRRWRMNAFRHSLIRTGLGPDLDITRNVTCFTPNDAAFAAAGNLNTTANVTVLENLIKLHTIVEPLYTSFLEDGQTFTTFSNQTIRITFRDGDIYVNDARIINKNVMTNNGLMHVLEKVITPLNEDEIASISSTQTAAPSTRTDAPIATASVITVTESASSGLGAQVSIESSSWFWTVLSILGFLGLV